MTAKELKNKHSYHFHPSIDEYGNIIGAEQPMFYFSAPDFQIFCEQLCREQREICAEKYEERPYEYTNEDYIINEIINAKQPEL